MITLLPVLWLSQNLLGWPHAKEPCLWVIWRKKSQKILTSLGQGIWNALWSMVLIPWGPTSGLFCWRQCKCPSPLSFSEKHSTRQDSPAWLMSYKSMGMFFVKIWSPLCCLHPSSTSEKNQAADAGDGGYGKREATIYLLLTKVSVSNFGSKTWQQRERKEKAQDTAYLLPTRPRMSALTWVSWFHPHNLPGAEGEVWSSHLTETQTVPVSSWRPPSL